MNSIEVTAKTVEDAVIDALVKLETTRENFDYEVIEKGSSGILGMFSKPAKIKAWKKEELDLDVLVEAKKEKKIEKKVEKVEKVEKTEKKEIKFEFNNSKTAEKVETVEEKVAAPAPKKNTISKEKATEISTKFLTDVFNAMDMKVEIEVEVDEEGVVYVDMKGDEMGVLIGKRGQTLDSLQYLLSLVINKETDGYTRVKLDTENYRKRRQATLESLAKNIAYKVKRTRRAVSLEPMNPYERRVIHSALQNDRYVSTRSEGEEPFRHVVVFLKK